MANVLPPEDRSLLKKEYWVRLALASSIVMSAAFIVGIISLMPAYIAARVEHEEIVQYKELQSKERDAGKQDTAMKSARLVRSGIDVLNESVNFDVTLALDQVVRSWESHAEDIIISSFNYSTSENSLRTLQVSGEAQDRASLSAFVNTLRKDPLFAVVSLPVSDLAGSNDTTFSLIITGDF